MENHAYEVAKVRALTLCREAAADPIPVGDAVNHLWQTGPLNLTQEQREEIQALELVFQVVGHLQEVGAALGSAPEEPAPVVIHRPQAGAVVVPKPSNV